jgi:serine/threonine-protein kinase HipA
LAGAITIRSADGGGYRDKENDELSPEEQQEGQAKAFRFSLAGVQLKFSAVSESRGGLTIPARGVGGSWIVKLPSMAFSGVPENEFSMMTLARKVQIEVPDVDLVPMTSIKGLPEGIEQISGQALVVRRFDRTDQGDSIHIEDFAQIFNLYPEDKYGKASYQNIARVLWAEIGKEGIAEFVRRLVFNTLIGNADMHLKNWSLIYRDQRQPSLSPGYDFVSTIAYIPDEDMALKLGKTKKMTDLTVEQLKYFAGKAALPENLVVRTAQETVEVFKTVWEEEKQNLPLQKSVLDKIEAHLPTIPLYSAK